MTDQTCHDEHERIEAKLDQHAKDLTYHMDEVHGELMQRTDIIAADRQIASHVEELAVAVLGPRLTKFQGGGRDAKLGIKAIVDENRRGIVRLEAGQERIDRQISNGGVKSRLSGKDRAAVWVAAISAFASVIVAALALMGH